MKIVGNTVGTTMPKPNLLQTDPTKGDYVKGKEEFMEQVDVVSCTHEWNGTVLTITSASGTSSADLKGAKGDKGDTGATGEAGKNGSDGKTPVRGTDYWTEADKAEIKSYVDNAILGGAW